MTSSYECARSETRQSYHGVNGRTASPQGWKPCLECYATNAQRKSRTTFIGIDGKPVVITMVTPLSAENTTSDGNELEELTSMPRIKPTLERDSGIHRVVHVFDGRGKVTRKRFGEPRGEPFLHKTVTTVGTRNTTTGATGP